MIQLTLEEKARHGRRWHELGSRCASMVIKRHWAICPASMLQRPPLFKTGHQINANCNWILFKEGTYYFLLLLDHNGFPFVIVGDLALLSSRLFKVLGKDFSYSSVDMALHSYIEARKMFLLSRVLHLTKQIFLLDPDHQHVPHSFPTHFTSNLP